MATRSVVIGLVGVMLCAGTAWAGERSPVVGPFDGEGILFDYGAGDGPGVSGVGPGMQAGADHIIDMQCPNGGWNWPHGGCANTFNNITAPIALGILNAYSSTADPAHLAAAVAGGDFDLTFKYTDEACDADKARFGAFASYFLWKLSAASGDSTYSDWAEAEFFDALDAGTYGCNSNVDTAGWIAAVQAGRTGVWINLRPWEFHNLIPTATAIGNAGQDTLFLDGLLDGLDTLDATDPNAAYYDTLGVAGGVLGLALSGTLGFPAISSPNALDINGIDNLHDLADVLAGYQNANGSWYWHSDLPGPGVGDESTQVSAYATMALAAADGVLPAPPYYETEIGNARDWLRSMQLPNGGFYSWGDGGENTEVDGEALNALVPDPCTDDVLEFLLGAGSDCVQPSETVTVELHQRNLQQPVRGFQAFGQFDSSVMTHVSNTFESIPYGLVLVNSVVGDDIDLAAGIDDQGGQMPTDVDALLVTLEFTAGATEGPTTVSFRFRDPPSRFTDEIGGEVVPCLVESPTIIIDGTDPVITCPGNINENADAGVCTLTIDPFTWATATDNLDPNPTITWVRSDGAPNLTDPYNFGVTTITWTATDCAGNTDTCDQTITVSAYNELVVEVELSPTVVVGPFTRCISFELWECDPLFGPVQVEDVLSFDSGSATATVLVGCADYDGDCITARDRLHTLRRTGTLSTQGSEPVQYVATGFTGGDALIGGNLNDDPWIDILDFGIFSFQWNTDFGTGDTDCNTSPPHSDINGSGVVDTADFTFIQINFLEGHEDNCCGQDGLMGDGPITAISVKELRKRGLGHLVAADLNHDGMLDEADIVAFMEGARPQRRPTKASFGGTMGGGR